MEQTLAGLLQAPWSKPSCQRRRTGSKLALFWGGPANCAHQCIWKHWWPRFSCTASSHPARVLSPGVRTRRDVVAWPSSRRRPGLRIQSTLLLCVQRCAWRRTPRSLHPWLGHCPVVCYRRGARALVHHDGPVARHFMAARWIEEANQQGASSQPPCCCNLRESVPQNARVDSHCLPAGCLPAHRVCAVVFATGKPRSSCNLVFN